MMKHSNHVHIKILLSVLSLIALIVVSSCATKPIAKQLREAAMAEGVTFPMVLQKPDAHVGDIVLWGGTIIETTNMKDGTEIIVLEIPLSGDERPGTSKDSQGRFIATSSKFLDPAIYKSGRQITIAGEVAGKKTLPLGKTSYTYPVVTVKQVHLWEKKHRYRYVYPYGYWGWGPYWDGWYPSYYYDYDDFDYYYDNDLDAD